MSFFCTKYTKTLDRGFLWIWMTVPWELIDNMSRVPECRPIRSIYGRGQIGEITLRKDVLRALRKKSMLMELENGS